MLAFEMLSMVLIICVIICALKEKIKYMFLFLGIYICVLIIYFINTHRYTICPTCESEMLTSYCTNCGTFLHDPLGHSTIFNICQNCGSQAPGEYCGVCGVMVEKESINYENRARTSLSTRER